MRTTAAVLREKGHPKASRPDRAREMAQQVQGHPKASTRTGLGRWLSRYRGIPKDPPAQGWGDGSAGAGASQSIYQNRAGEMAQQVQGLTAKLDDLNLISRTHMVERELTPTYFPLISTGLLLYMH